MSLTNADMCICVSKIMCSSKRRNKSNTWLPAHIVGQQESLLNKDSMGKSFEQSRHRSTFPISCSSAGFRIWNIKVSRSHSLFRPERPIGRSDYEEGSDRDFPVP